MIIGIDLDGVVFDTDKEIRTQAELYDMQIGGKGQVNPHEYEINIMYDWNKEDTKIFRDTYLPKIVKEATLMVGAKEILKRLQSDGHKLICITSRGNWYPEMIEYTNDIFKKEDIKFSKVLFAANTKLEACKEENVDVMIDDCYETCVLLQNNKIPVLYFKARRMKKIQEDAYTKDVTNWGEIYREICRLEEMKNGKED